MIDSSNLASEEEECFYNRLLSMAKRHASFHDDDDDDDGEQPECVDLVQPCADFHVDSEFKYDDGGADCDWSSNQCQYPDNLGLNFLDNLKNTEEDLENE
jgi:hypothetical protein